MATMQNCASRLHSLTAVGFTMARKGKEIQTAFHFLFNRILMMGKEFEWCFLNDQHLGSTCVMDIR